MYPGPRSAATSSTYLTVPPARRGHALSTVTATLIRVFPSVPAATVEELASKDKSGAASSIADSSIAGGIISVSRVKLWTYSSLLSFQTSAAALNEDSPMDPPVVSDILVPHLQITRASPRTSACSSSPILSSSYSSPLLSAASASPILPGAAGLLFQDEISLSTSVTTPTMLAEITPAFTHSSSLAPMTASSSMSAQMSVDTSTTTMAIPSQESGGQISVSPLPPTTSLSDLL